VRDAPGLPPFDRRFFDGTEPVSRVGSGSIGGKASGLASIRGALGAGIDSSAFPSISVGVPRMVVIATGFFDQFVALNRLDRLAVEDLPDQDIALAFQAGDLPVELVGDLRALVEGVRSPLAVRSSSLLEDALYRPFAGVYGTKMIPNHHFDPTIRFRRLVEAIKFVWASTWFREARLPAGGREPGTEKMAVIIQEVVGRGHRGRFYPDLSGVARTSIRWPARGPRTVSLCSRWDWGARLWTATLRGPTRRPRPRGRRPLPASTRCWRARKRGSGP
jgi:hypothetical protein